MHEIDLCKDCAHVRGDKYEEWRWRCAVKPRRPNLLSGETGTQFCENIRRVSELKCDMFNVRPPRPRRHWYYLWLA